jgi:hypothetical protein
MTIVHLVDPHHFVHALSTVSRYPLEAFVKNSKLKSYHDIVLMALHEYADIFREMAFNSLLEYHKWDYAIELECKPSPGV